LEAVRGPVEGIAEGHTGGAGRGIQSGGLYNEILWYPGEICHFTGREVHQVDFQLIEADGPFLNKIRVVKILCYYHIEEPKGEGQISPWFRLQPQACRVHIGCSEWINNDNF
jgi:hypothetical protein